MYQCLTKSLKGNLVWVIKHSQLCGISYKCIPYIHQEQSVAQGQVNANPLVYQVLLKTDCRVLQMSEQKQVSLENRCTQACFFVLPFFYYKMLLLNICLIKVQACQRKITLNLSLYHRSLEQSEFKNTNCLKLLRYCLVWHFAYNTFNRTII